MEQIEDKQNTSAIFFQRLTERLKGESVRLKEAYQLPGENIFLINHALKHTMGMVDGVLSILKKDDPAYEGTLLFKEGLEKLHTKLRNALVGRPVLIKTLSEAYCLLWSLDENLEFIDYIIKEGQDKLADKEKSFLSNNIDVYNKIIESLKKASGIELVNPLDSES